MRRAMLAVTLALAIAAPAFAQDAKQDPPKRKSV